MTKNKKDPKPQNNNQTIECPLVGIGASAGGLEALQEFFQSMPDNPEVAFIVVQHLSPDYKSFMSELLSRHTSMPIHTVTDGMLVKKNNIYLIPPRNNMTIMNGKLLLTKQENRGNLNLPIDIFLKSLALDQEKNAIGIILSGTGSDGALGIRAIKENGGIAMVQDDQSAKFDGMPRSSISTGMVDFILPPAQLAEELVSYVKHPFIKKNKFENQINSNENQLLKVISILRDAYKVDFSSYKENTIIRRLEKRISINRFNSLEDYIKFLNNNKQEINKLFNDLLIGVTRFFRDEKAYYSLSEKVIPDLFNSQSSKKELRFWVVGCATGEEAYSLAVLLKEYIDTNNIRKDIKIFATDIDQNALEYAGLGLFPESISTEISQELLSKYFVKKHTGYQVSESIRNMIVFAKHNVMHDPPFSKINLISCRNLLIYFKTPAQQKVLSMFYVSLVENGYLFLGNSESLGNLSEGFTTIDNKYKIYKQIKGFKANFFQKYGVPSYLHSRLEQNQQPKPLKQEFQSKSIFENLINEVMNSYLPPSVIIDHESNILYAINKVNKYLKLPLGQISLNLLKMLPKKLSIIVSNLLRRAESTNTETIIENINIEEDEKMSLSISAKLLKEPRTKNIYFLISFIEKEKSTNQKINKIKKIDINKHYEEKILQLEKELQEKSENLQATVEELETSNEELQSSNEELIASNEELQSTNEELQSVNEELYTVNSEHVKKIDELTELYADMDNLLRNTLIGTIYLDANLTIRKVNDIATKLVSVLPSDIGRPIADLSFNNLYSGFVKDISIVRDNLKSIDKNIKIEKKWYLLRIIPYRTAENAVDGIIILIIDITNLVESQNEVKELSKKLENIMDTGEVSWWEWDYEKNIVRTGKGKTNMLGYEHNEISGGFEEWVKLIHPEDYSHAMEAMTNHLSKKTEYYDVEYRIKNKQGKYIWFKDKGKITKYTKSGDIKTLSGIVININKDKMELQAEKNTGKKLNIDLTKSHQAYDLLLDKMKQGVVFQNEKGEIINANPAAENILGLSLEQLQGKKSVDPDWRSTKEDGTAFPGEEHPAMIALKTRKPVKNVLMGVYNPKQKKNIWINIDAYPLFYKNQKQPYQVYAIFEIVERK